MSIIYIHVQYNPILIFTYQLPRPGLALKYQNIFPLANTFAKRENVRPGQSPIGTQMVSINTFLGHVCGRH